jgi:hypothetical protein
MSDETMMSEATETATDVADQLTPEQLDVVQRPGETKAEAARRIRIQWQGREEEVDDKTLVDTLLEALGEDGVRNVAQLGKAARTKVAKLGEQEHALKQAAEDLRDPQRLFKLVERIHGRKAARAFVEDYYAGIIEEEGLPPEERERRQIKSELEQLRAEKERLSREREEREMATRAQQAQQQIGKAFKSALGEVGLDATPHVMARMAALAEAQLAEGVPFDARELAREVAQEYEGGEVAGYIQRLAKSPEKLVKYLGADGLRALREYDVKRARQAQAPAPAATAPAPRKSSEKRDKIPVDDFFANLRKR